MSRYLARLAKLEAAVIPLPPVRTDDRPQISLSEMLEPIKARTIADAAFLETATPLQLVVFHRDAVARIEKRLVDATGRSDNPLVETLRKVQKVWLPRFLDDARADVRQAEINLIREAGFTSLDQPGAREHLELELFAA